MAYFILQNFEGAFSLNLVEFCWNPTHFLTSTFVILPIYSWIIDNPKDFVGIFREMSSEMDVLLINLLGLLPTCFKRT